MVTELTDKHLAAINRGRKAKGLKPIRRKKTELSQKKRIDKIRKEEKQKMKKGSVVWDARKSKLVRKTETKKKKLPKIVPKNYMEATKTENDFYREYKRLGGKKTRAKYKTLLNKFYDHTMDIFVHGDASRYKSRNLALNGFRKAAKIDNKEVDRIFSSVDNVHAYT